MKIHDWFMGQKPHFGNPKSQRLLRDRQKKWDREQPRAACEIPGGDHICSDRWCRTRARLG